MGLRFFKRIKVLPGLSVNLTKSGPSVTVGMRGAHVTLGSKGITKTVGIPGTGVFYTTRNGHTGAHSAPIEKPVPITARLEPELASKLKEDAKAQNRSPGEQLEWIVSEHYRNQ